jgi:DnaK suppressor protein
VTDREAAARRREILDLLETHRRGTEARYREALGHQQSGDAAGDSEGVHGWKASREGGADIAILAALDRTRRQIDAALARAHAGTYGRCAACDAPIPLARLRALPFATHCVICRTRAETLEKA